MSKPISLRIDDTEQRALDFLCTRKGLTKTAVIKNALLAAEREERNRQLREEAARLANSPADLKAVREVQEDMEGLRAAW